MTRIADLLSSATLAKLGTSEQRIKATQKYLSKDEVKLLYLRAAVRMQNARIPGMTMEQNDDQTLRRVYIRVTEGHSTIFTPQVKHGELCFITIGGTMLSENEFHQKYDLNLQRND